MRIVQVSSSIDSGDGISNNVLLIKKKLNSIGVKSDIYAINISKKLKEKNIKKFKCLPKLKKDDVIIYHMCEKTIINDKLKKINCKKIAIYHNTTPPDYFVKYYSEIYKHQCDSIIDIQSMKNIFNWCIADSEYNKQDLIKMGYAPDNISVIPILLDFDDYKQQPDKDIINKYKDGYTNIIFVGRIAPNKKHEDVIRAFAYYKKNINNKSRLILVGSPMGDAYINDLKTYIEALELNDVIFTEKISFPEILAFYSIADIFLCMSEHEGFCIPLVEAMMFDVPIVAYDNTAIPYTLNGSGVLIDEKDPVLVSQIINTIITNKNIKQEIINKQRERLKDFDTEEIFKKLYSVIIK